MINVVEPLVTSRFASKEFKRNTVLNTNITIENLNSTISGTMRGNANKRKNSKAKARRSKKY